MDIRRDFAPVISISLLLLSAVAIGNLSFNVANVVTGEEVIPEFPSERPEEVNGTAFGADPEVLKVGFIAFFVCLLVVIVTGIAYAIYRGENLGEYLPLFEFLGGILAIAFIIGAVLFFHDISGSFEALIKYFSFGEPAEGGGPTGPGGGIKTTREFPIYFTITLLASLVLLTSLFLYHFLPSFKDAVLAEGRERARRRRILARKVRRTISGLESGGDFRSTVLRCYSDMCFILLSTGVEGHPSLTPREFEVIARKEAGLSEDSIATLTGIFEIARYSDHDISEEQRDMAICSLKEIQSELEEGG
ncbi:MAG: DUF4129 domain-containing protein [Thermoplasmata archaeon]